MNPPLDHNADLGSVGASCCPVSGLVELATSHASGGKPNIHETSIAEPSAFVKTASDGEQSLYLMVENMSCAACISKIETSLLALPGVRSARVNMSTRRLVVTWDGPKSLGLEVVQVLTRLGYPAAPYSPELLKHRDNKERQNLLAALAVAGFSASNVMLLSVAVWAGAFSDMGGETRSFFHWVSAVIAMPAIAYSGQPFFRSALRALKTRNMNMDVPISLAVVIAASMSLYQTSIDGEHAYFDASISLLFFLLIGRYLDFSARSHARHTAEHLMALRAQAAIVRDPSGQERSVPSDQLKRGMVLVVAGGDKIAADGRVLSGETELDTSLLTGETLPVYAKQGDPVFAGTLNTGNPVLVEITAVADGTLLSEIVRLVENAEQGRARFVRIAERAAKKYVPVVHAIAALTFIGWMLVASNGWEHALMTATAVLIITCPCALALAVPVVQVITSGCLLRKGVIVKSADGLERLAECDTIVFDKTGTLTKGDLELQPDLTLTHKDLSIAAALAAYSRHPLSRAICRAAQPTNNPVITNIKEQPGHGVEARVEGKKVRLGRKTWVCEIATTAENRSDDLAECWLALEEEEPVRFSFRDQLRDDANEVIALLKDQGVRLVLLSGDREMATASVAGRLGISEWKAELLPADKVTYLTALKEQGRRVLMVGDGINDAPALASGHASMSPASASDISQTLADFVFQGDRLSPVFLTLLFARKSDRIIRQNFALALAYNLFAIPIAVAGLATPLIAAIAMSSSSLLVTCNALRLKMIAKG